MDRQSGIKPKAFTGTHDIEERKIIRRHKLENCVPGLCLAVTNMTRRLNFDLDDELTLSLGDAGWFKV